MKGVRNPLDGFQTWILCVATGLLLIVRHLDIYPVPTEVIDGMFVAIFAAHRHGTKKAEKAAREAASANDEFRKWRNQ